MECGKIVDWCKKNVLYLENNKLAGQLSCLYQVNVVKTPLVNEIANSRSKLLNQWYKAVFLNLLGCKSR